MLNYIYKVLQTTCLTKDIIIIIINQLFKHKWNIITRKIKIRINAISFNIISKLLIDNIEHITTTTFNEKKEYCIRSIDINDMSKDTKFKKYLKNIGDDFYDPIEILGKSHMRVEDTNKLYAHIRELYDCE